MNLTGWIFIERATDSIMHNVLFPHSVVSAMCKQANMLWTVALCDCVMTLWNLVSILVSSWESGKRCPSHMAVAVGGVLLSLSLHLTPLFRENTIDFHSYALWQSIMGCLDTPVLVHQQSCHVNRLFFFFFFNLKIYLLIQTFPVRGHELRNQRFLDCLTYKRSLYY